MVFRYPSFLSILSILNDSYAGNALPYISSTSTLKDVFKVLRKYCNKPGIITPVFLSFLPKIVTLLPTPEYPNVINKLF